MFAYERASMMGGEKKIRSPNLPVERPSTLQGLSVIYMFGPSGNILNMLRVYAGQASPPPSQCDGALAHATVTELSQSTLGRAEHIKQGQSRQSLDADVLRRAKMLTQCQRGNTHAYPLLQTDCPPLRAAGLKAAIFAVCFVVAQVLRRRWRVRALINDIERELGGRE
ncbi:hypothetical protein BC629DRAFT_1447779 [Irpex lacteus]|nr:hypothetical protein BC629DRAFT_1447779 [Irpex lacteus]